MSPLMTPFRLLLATIIALCSLQVQAQDYRTVASGNWTSPGIWEVNDGSGWMNASEFPIAGNSTLIDVRSPHTVTVSGQTGGDFSIDDLIIRFGATLTIA
ncbi:MAG TPA: hypothetical protein PKY96_11805, partial [Flavobacteriales bacterium]|nr:hypothetical protein [Flavobacteriales bacterium]